MVRKDKSDSSIKSIHLRDQHTVRIWNKLRDEGINLSELISAFLHDVYRKRQQMQTNNYNYTFSTTTTTSNEINLVEESEVQELQLNNNYELLNHRNHINTDVLFYPREKQIEYYANKGKTCPECMKEYDKLNNIAEQEEMIRDAAKLKAKLGLELEQQQEQPEQEQEIVEEIIEVPFITA